MAIFFDFVDDFVDCGTAAGIDNLTSMTVSAWVNYTSNSAAGKYPVVISKVLAAGNVGWYFYFDGDTANDNLTFYRSCTGNDLFRTVSTVISKGAWNHILVTHDGSLTATNIHIYLNGVEVSYATAQDGTIAFNDESLGNLYIGNNDALTGTDCFKGYIQEVSLWNVVLELSEIKTIAQSRLIGIPLNIKRSSLVGYWPMEDGVPGSSAHGATVRDASGNGNTGTGDDGVNNTGMIWAEQTAISYVKERKNLFPMGTRIGSRQMQESF